MKVQRNQFREQYDYVLGEYIEKVKSKYKSRIGLFFIRFSALEHTLEICISDQLLDRSHQFGYLIIEGMTLNGKIDLFRKLFQGFLKGTPRKHQTRLGVLVKKLHAARVFRNYVSHAYWNTLENTGYVRTRIDEANGDVIFKRVRITPQVLDAWIRRVVDLELNLNEFSDSVHNR